MESRFSRKGLFRIALDVAADEKTANDLGEYGDYFHPKLRIDA